MSTITLEVPGADLVAGLTAVLPHAGTDDTLPMLAAVNFTVRDGHLMLAATDRYTLGTYRLVEVKDDVELDVILPRRDAQDLLTRAKKCKHFPPPLTFDTAKRELTFTDYERTVTYSLLDAEFVRWWAVLPERDADRTVVGINPVNFARLAKATDPKRPEHVRMEIGLPNKSIRVEVGERFVGVVMPVRLPDATPAPAPVAEVEPEPEPVAPEVEAPVSPDEPAEDDEANTQWHESEVELADDPQSEGGPEDEVAEDEVPDVADGEVGAEPTELDCPSCKGFGVVKGKPAADGTPRPFRTANGAATATTAVECPTCHGDRIAAA